VAGAVSEVVPTEGIVLLLVTGASGSGKSTTLAALAERFPAERVSRDSHHVVFRAAVRQYA
jgi:Tfp pilus assembly pilus retraction ATPase PilT